MSIEKFVLNETSYFGFGAREVLPEEIKNRGYKKVLVVTDKSLFEIELLNRYNKTNEIKTLGYPDEFIKQATVDEIEKKYNLDTESILNTIRKWSKYE